MQFIPSQLEEQSTVIIRGAANMVTASGTFGCLVTVRLLMRNDKECDVIVSVRGKVFKAAEAVLATIADILTIAPSPFTEGNAMQPFYFYNDTD